MTHFEYHSSRARINLDFIEFRKKYAQKIINDMVYFTLVLDLREGINE